MWLRGTLRVPIQHRRMLQRFSSGLRARRTWLVESADPTYVATWHTKAEAAPTGSLLSTSIPDRASFLQ